MKSTALPARSVDELGFLDHVFDFGLWRHAPFFRVTVSVDPDDRTLLH